MKLDGLTKAVRSARKYSAKRISKIRRSFSAARRRRWLGRLRRLVGVRARRRWIAGVRRMAARYFHFRNFRPGWAMQGWNRLVQRFRLRRKPSARPIEATPWFRLNMPAAIALLAGFCLTGTAFLLTRDMYMSVAEQEFDRQASHYVLALRKSVDRHVELMESATALFDGSTVVTGRWDLFNFAKNQLSHYPGYLAVAWVPIVPAQNREAFVRRAEADGLSGFAFTEITSTGHTMAAASRERHLPVYYIEPYEGNEGLLGFDMASRPALGATLAQARQRGEMIVADWLDPRGAPYTDGKTLMLIQPIFGNGKTAAHEDMRPDGFMIGIIKLDRLFATTLREFTTPAWLDTYLYRGDEKQAADPVHVEASALRESFEVPPAAVVADTDFAISADLAFADRQYRLAVRPVPGKMDLELGFVPWGVMIFGLALTLLLTRYIAVSRYKQMQIEVAVVERTAELARANQANIRLEREINERKRIEAALRTAKDEAEVANRAKSEFLAMVSHELRTPLNAIIGFSEMLSSEMFGAIGDRRYRGYASDIRDSGLHLLSLINDILDLSKVEANRFELSEADLELPRLVADTVHLLEGKARSGRIELTEKLPKDLPALHADERAVKQIVLNLLSNAIKFTPAGGKVAVSAEIDKRGEFVISVTDTGIGIAEKDRERILKPFTQVDSSLARKFEGTGLGLPLTKSLVELHGGRLALESVLGEGTRVHATFPRNRVIQNHIAAE